ncbi:hypothetical protein BGZ73_002168 [Actinomortierella ambigua]|nr:hypothetical protein BGZ73_002168 [Actinomortierella ambigua]
MPHSRSQPSGFPTRHHSQLVYSQKQSHASVFRAPILLSLVILLINPQPLPYAASPPLSPLSSIVCDAAPTLWSPVINAIEKSDGFLANLLGHGQPHSATSSPIDGDNKPQENPPTQYDAETPSVSADDYGVVHLDLEGDPSCDYTTKITIAGKEFSVIIDTGSAHAAVASNACKDCVIPLKIHHGFNDEESIPIDLTEEEHDADSDDASPSQLNEPESIASKKAGDDELNLLRLLRDHFNRPTAHPPSKDSPSGVLSTTSTTAAATTVTSTATTEGKKPRSTAQFPPKASNTSPSSSSVVSTLHRDKHPSDAQQMSSLRKAAPIQQSPPTQTKRLGAVLPLSSSSARVSFDEIIEHARQDLAKSVASMPSMIDPVTSSVSRQIQQQRTWGQTKDLRRAFNQQQLQQQQQGQQLSQADLVEQERMLAASSTGNLYSLSTTSKLLGQPIRVSYGIKTHSVGWSGVMVSDLMTLNMVKVTPQKSSVADDPNQPKDRVASYGDSMEKETSVEFAAITENKEFFSKECGAQQGIWGLGYRTLSVDRRPTLLDTLSVTMKIPNGFALQLCGSRDNTTKTGNMFLGGYSTRHLAEPLTYIPLVKKDWYQVQLDGFRVMGNPVHGMANLNVPKSIVDSGTTNILMSHYNLQSLLRSLASSDVVVWSNVISLEDIRHFWFDNAVLRLPRSAFEVSTKAHAVEVVLSGVPIPIYTSSFLRIKPVPVDEAPPGYVDFWWHGFASSTPPEAIEMESATGGAVLPGSVGTILGETLFAGKVVYFERGDEDAAPGDANFGRIGFAKGQNCFAPADHASIDVLANQGQLAKVSELGPVRVAAVTSAGSRNSASSSGRKSSSPNGSQDPGKKEKTQSSSSTSASSSTDGQQNGNIHAAGSSPPPGEEGDGKDDSKVTIPFHFGYSGVPIRLMGDSSHTIVRHRGWMSRLAVGLMMVWASSILASN